MLKTKTAENASYIPEGSIVLLECEQSLRSFLLIYRLSVEPRPRLRREDKTAVSYSVTVEKLHRGKRTRESLRDFTSDKAVAEEFYRLITRRQLFPEHLTDFYEDYMS